jgi:hypothetical protein
MIRRYSQRYVRISTVPRSPRADRGYLRAPLTAVFRSPAPCGSCASSPAMAAAGRSDLGARRRPAQRGRAPRLRALADTGVVRAEGQGRVTAYRLDGAHPLAPAIAALLTAEDARADRVLDAIRAAAAPYRPEAVWLFGSAARGETRRAATSTLRSCSGPARPRRRSTGCGRRSGRRRTPSGSRSPSSGCGRRTSPAWRPATRCGVRSSGRLPLVGPPPALLRRDALAARPAAARQRRRGAGGPA